jgi:hypothetical protein
VSCKHGRLPDRCTECAIETDRDQLLQANALLRKELNVHKERGNRMNELVCYAYQRTNKALMMPPSKPREARAEREQAICDINKKLGGALR